MKRVIYLLMVMVAAVSCKGYQEKPFGGLNGKVEQVKILQRLPEMWYAGNVGTDVVGMNAVAYDMFGNELCSALMDSAGQVLSEDENLFENDVCVRSIHKSGGRILVRQNLVSAKRGRLEYIREMGGQSTRIVVKKSSFGCWHKSVIYEDGLMTSINRIRTDFKGYPVVITEKDLLHQTESREVNKYDKKHNIIEKHIFRTGEKEKVVYTDYFDFDKHGNWTEARTYNTHRLPEWIITREIKYWE